MSKDNISIENNNNYSDGINDNNKINDLNEKIYELKYIKFIIKDYSSFPRTERVKLLMFILNVPISFSDLEKKFGHILYGFNFKPKEEESFPKKFDNSLKIIINNHTDICFYYLEYRILFFLDLSQSMLLFDLRQKILNIQKTEKYLNYLLQSCAQYEDIVYDFNLNKIKYKPKIICTIASSSNIEEIIFIKHAFILDKENYNIYQEKISKKINSILSKYEKRNQDNEIEKQIIFLHKILENSLFTFNLMSSTGSRILFLLTDGNFYLPKLGKYNNILMQLNRIDISIQIIDLFYRNNCYGLTSPTFVNDIETMKYLAQFTGGNYINENDFIKFFFPEYKNNKNEDHIFFYPSLYPNIINYNSNIEESKALWKRRFNDYFDEKQIHCVLCEKNFGLFLCKKILINENNNNSLIKEITLNEKIDINKIINSGLNIKYIGLLKNNINVSVKELFESYRLKLSLSLIIDARIRESFYLKKTKNRQKIKFIMYFLPGINIKYNLTKEKTDILCEEFRVEIFIKGDICKINQIKKEIIEKNKKSEKLELLLNFIKEINCTDKISSYFSQILQNPGFLENDFFQKNRYILPKVTELTVHKWHRFFNVMMGEIFIMDKGIVINKNFIEKFLKSDKYAVRKRKEKKAYLKNKIIKFCDDFNEVKHIGIKKISKEENKKGCLSHNGFVVIKYDWVYKNLCLIYLGFFHCFLTTRNIYYNKIKDFILNKEDQYNDKDLLIKFNDKHLTYFFTHPKKEYDINNDLNNLKHSGSNKSLNLKKSTNGTKVYKGLKNQLIKVYSTLKEKESGEINGESIFTYHTSQKLISLYLKQFQTVYMLPIDSEIVLSNFLEMILLQRIKNEKFQILNWNRTQMILFSYLSELNIKNYSSSNVKNNTLLNKIIIFYTLEIINEGEKKLINTKLILEPNENLYISNPEGKNNNKNEFKSYFKSIINHFQETEIKIRETLKIPEIPEINEIHES